MIKQVQRKNIDDERWNSIIAASKHETIYPYTWYMDASADQWFGLVMGDYEFIMPVAYRKKYTIKYIYQPFHNQQLGIYSEKMVDEESSLMFLNKIHKDFLKGDYSFNSGNNLPEDARYTLSSRQNYVLSLNGEYEALQKNYTSNARRNLRKSSQFELEISDGVGIKDFVEFKHKNNRKSESEAYYQNMSRLLLELERMGKSKLFGVYLEKELVAVAVFLFSKKRIIDMLAASNEKGRESCAMYHLIDASIRKHAGEELLLDFEGSSIKSIARFFADFGSTPEIYQRVNFDRLPLKKNIGKKNV